LIDSSSYLFFFIATAATNLVASAIAADDHDGAERIVSEALFLALCCGTFLGGLVLSPAGEPLLALIAGKASASVVPSALNYATVRAFGQPFVIMASVARAAGKYMDAMNHLVAY
jgi:Na+-driven multidrug efflux pump